MNQRQTGIAILIVTLISAPIFLTDQVFFRLFIGLLIGFALVRGLMGFAGSVSRAYHCGSTQLLQTLLWVFAISSMAVAAILYSSNVIDYKLSVHPINLGLISGALMFGFGMPFATACASGILTSMGGNPLPAIVTMLFFGVGVFLGFPIQHTASWVTESWVHSSAQVNGIFFPDLFGQHTFVAYFGGVAITFLFATIAVNLAKRFERKAIEQGKSGQNPMETRQQQIRMAPNKNASLFEQVFVIPWSALQAGLVMAFAVSMLFLVTHKGWGVTTEFGTLVGKLLWLSGVSIHWLTDFSGFDAKRFTTPLWENGAQMQNLAIFWGALIAKLTMSEFNPKWSLSYQQLLPIAFGGLVMGLGTRLANGCNVGGALHTDITNVIIGLDLFMLNDSRWCSGLKVQINELEANFKS